MPWALMVAAQLVLASSPSTGPAWLRDPQHITVDLHRADVRVLIQALVEAGQLNAVIADPISGRVTLKIHDLPWDQALQAVLKAKQLGMVRVGNLIRVDTAANLAAEKAQEHAAAP
jgi:type IV pilus assembly protein PilQ